MRKFERKKFQDKTRNEEHNKEEHTPTTTHTRLRGTAYATRESSDFLVKHIFNT
jgi:hypothetical protein